MDNGSIDEMGNGTTLKENYEPLKQTMLDLKALKHTIQNLQCNIPSDSSTLDISKEKIVTESESANSSVLINTNESLLEGEGINPKWLIAVTQIYNTLQTTVSILQTKLEEVRPKSPQNHSCSEFVDLSDETDKQKITQEHAIDNKELKPELPQRINENNELQVEVKEIFDTLSKVNVVNTEIENIMPHYIKYTNPNKIYDSTNTFHDEKIKLSFEKAILYHKEYTNLLEQCKYIEVKIKTTNKLLNHLNNEMSKKIQELTESLSNISQQNTKLHFSAVFALNHVRNLHEKIAGLSTKKTCLGKKLHEKEVYLTNITSDVSKLSYCLNSFLEFEKMVQQHFLKKSTNTSQDNDQLITQLSTKKDELKQIESMISDNNCTIIPPIKKEIVKWRNAYQEASKEIEDFNKNLYILNKKKEQLKNDDTIVKQDVEAVKTHIIMQKDVFKIKRQKYKKNKRDLERKYKEVKGQLQRIIHAIVLDDMCYARLKMADKEDSYKNELKLLLTGHNECRARKQHTTMMAEKIKDSIKIIYNELMSLKEISYNSRCSISYELITTKSRHSTHEQGILFLHQKKQTLKENIKSLQKQIIAVQKSTEFSAFIILIIQSNIKNMNLKINIWNKEKKKGMEMLGFRIPMAALYVEEKTPEERGTGKFKSVRDIKKMKIINKQHAFCLIFTFLCCYYYYCFLISLLSVSMGIMFYEAKLDHFYVQYINKKNYKRSIKVM